MTTSSLYKKILCDDKFHMVSKFPDQLDFRSTTLRIHSSCKETSDFEEVALFTNQEGLNSHEELFKNKFRDFGNRVLKVASVPVITHINLLILSFLNIENNKKISFFTKRIIGYRLNYIFWKVLKIYFNCYWIED